MESAGKKRYEELTKDKKNTRNQGMTVWIALIVIGIVVATKNLYVGIVMVVLGAVKGFLQMKEKNTLKYPLEEEDERNRFFEQLGKKSCRNFEQLRLVLTEDYMMSLQETVLVYKYQEIEKIEVGIQRGGSKPYHALFVTGKDGERRQFAISYDNADTQEAFDEVYQLINEKTK